MKKVRSEGQVFDFFVKRSITEVNPKVWTD